MEQNRDNLSSLLLALFILVFSIPYTTQLQSSQSWSLLRLQRLLNYPLMLKNLNNYTDVCYRDPSPYLTVVCYEESITQLQIIGQHGSPPLPKSFSIDSFFTTLTRLPDLKVLTLSSLGIWGPLPTKISRLSKLEILNMSSNYLSGSLPQQISYLKNLQTLILDHNMLTGVVPDWLSAFPLLTVLSLRNNFLNGSLPNSIMTLDNLRVFSLSSNNMFGNLPDLSSLTNLQALDLEDNSFGPQFPALQRKIAVIVLRKNKFTGALPQEVSSYYLLHHMDVSFNRFVGPFPSSLLNLPSICYLNVAGNRFTGMLSKNTSCNEGLEFVDLSLNLLTGSLPTCLAASSGNKNVSYAMNCLATNDQSQQHPPPFCQNEALAVGVITHNQKSTSDERVVLVTSVIGGVFAGVILIGFLVVFGINRANMRKAIKRPPRRLVVHASNGYPSKMLSDARYISQTMKLGTLGVPPYRSFSLEEIEAATNNFESSALMGEGSRGQMYKGKLKDGYQIVIKCLKLKRSQSTQNFIRHIELIAKLRHRHLVSALGHCFDYYLEDSTIRRLFLIFEYVPNGTLRSQVSGEAGTKITWNQRISAAIGVVKGIQFLHAGIIPGLFANSLKSTSILLDQNSVAKISSYNLPLLTEVNGAKQHKRRENQDDKIDVHDFGVILLEMITGKPISTQFEIEMVADQLRLSISADGTPRKRSSVIDPTVDRTCSNESLGTVIEICVGCVSKEPAERPSVEDVLWNLQFAAQVQDSWRGNSRSSDGSLSPSQNPPQKYLPLTFPVYTHIFLRCSDYTRELMNHFLFFFIFFENGKTSEPFFIYFQVISSSSSSIISFLHSFYQFHLFQIPLSTSSCQG